MTHEYIPLYSLFHISQKHREVDQESQRGVSTFLIECCLKAQQVDHDIQRGLMDILLLNISYKLKEVDQEIRRRLMIRFVADGPRLRVTTTSCTGHARKSWNILQKKRKKKWQFK